MISGKCFADLCKWVQDPRYPNRLEFHYAVAKHEDWVFVNGDYLGAFLRKIPAVVTKKFHVIVHNTDRSFGFAELHTLLRVAIHIYAVNATVSDAHLTPIPLGFRDCTLGMLATYTPPSIDRTIEVYGNFKVCNNETKRTNCMRALEGDRRVVWRSPDAEFESYLHDLCRSKFVLCPDGTGLDTHRVYEALLCGATPVVLRNALTPLYERLPICIVEDWTDPFVVPTGKTFSTDLRSFLT